MRIVSTIVFLILQFSQFSIAQSKQSEGCLFIIGGGTFTDSLRKQILVEGKWKSGDIIAVITLASLSGTEDSTWINSNNEFKKFTGRDALLIDSLSLHNAPKMDSFAKAKIILIEGGGQRKFMGQIEGTKVKEIIRQVYHNGGVIAGTSAGAAVMSKKMITVSPITKNVEINEGLGLLDSVIIDQHFLARNRYERLLKIQLENPKYQCIGIDESTAIVVRNGIASVTGNSQVLLFSDPKNVPAGKSGRYAGKDFVDIMFRPGEKFKIKK